MFDCGSLWHVHTKLDFIWRKKFKTLENLNVCKKRHAVTCRHACQVSSRNVASNYRVTLHQRTDDPNIAGVKTHVSNSGQKSFDFPSSEKQNASGKEEKDCSICMSVDHESGDNMSTLALSTFIWCDCTTQNHCMRMLCICMTECGKIELLIGKVSDRHSTVNVSELKQQKTNHISFPSHPWDICFSFESINIHVFVCETLFVVLTLDCEVRSPPSPHLPIWVKFTLFQTLQAIDLGMFLMCRKVSGDIVGIWSYGLGVPKILYN